ncbi:multicopper oxidase family protein [Enterovirga sp.]|uniref:multicopper oxidase family protein n=1 Tax=Enterovirga sp. TaxID=2026350 RepID=UPI0026200F12|nr:multicopper oxidase family protein [Enterovirga sp.]MDB5590094.1 multicopper oxidase type 3 [Enterovirga sp.]
MTTRLDRRGLLAGLAVTLTSLPAGRRALATAPDGVHILDAAPLPSTLVAGGEPAETWRFGGEAVEPVIRIRHGEEVRALLRNRTPKPLALHWHGVRAAPGPKGAAGLGGVPVPPGESTEYRFTPPDPGTYLIRPLVIGGSSEPAGRGLGGLLVVEEREPPAVDAEFALVIRDWLVQPSGALAPFGQPQEAATGGRLGNRITVAGAEAPKRIALPPGSRIRLRLANGCNARLMRIRFEGLKTFVAAVDGQPTDTFEPLRSTLPTAPGTRYDLLLDVPAEPGAVGRISALVGGGVVLVELVADGAAPVSRPVPAALPPNRLLPLQIALQNALRRDMALTGGATRSETGQVAYPADPARSWQVNGAPGSSAAAPLFSARRGQPVVLAIRNGTGFVQPVHVQGHVFRMLHPLDDGWEPYWFDTLQVAEGKTVRIAFEAGAPGRWMIASTVTERLDTGLWTWFEVT